MHNTTILMAHGAGGRMSRELIRAVFAAHFANPGLAPLSDAAVLPALPPGALALTTDSYVVQPLFFPGGDIGKLAVCGTVNDLAVSGATPLYLSAGFILEEGLPLETLTCVIASMAETARAAGVPIVTGDTKVVERGAADQLFINTAGVGVVPPGLALGAARLCAGDALLVNGTVGDHGLALMLHRQEMAFQSDLESDCAPLNGLIAAALDAAPGQVHWMRDATRGGLATVLNEWVLDAPALGIEIEEEAIPLRPAVRAGCEFLGLDPLYAANEGKAVFAVAGEAASDVLAALRAHPLGENAALIGRVAADHAGRVVLRTPYGARRVLPMLASEPMPRIC